MIRCSFPAAACLALSFALAIPNRALAQGSNNPLANVPKLKQVLSDNGFDVLQGGFRILDPVSMACVPCVAPLPCAERRDRAEPYIPTTWYNNVEPYMSIILPARFDDPDPKYQWEKAKRAIPINYLLRQDEAIVIVGSTPPPMAYYSFQTFLFARYNEASYNYAPPGDYFAPFEAVMAYLGDTVNSLTIRTTGSTPFNRPMAFISTGNRQTQERVRAALRSAGYADALINTETLPPSLVRFGYEKGDQFLFTFRLALAEGGKQAFDNFEAKVAKGDVMQVFRVRPRTEFSSEDPLPAPALRTRGTGQTEMDLFPTMEKLRQAIIDSYPNYDADPLDTFLPDYVPEGYPAIQRGIAYLGPGRDGSAGYGRDANYWASGRFNDRESSWFDLPDDAFAIAYGVDHAATGKATYSSVNVYLDRKITAGIATANSSDFRTHAGTASQYLPGAPGIEKFYVWKIARKCNSGDLTCLEAKLPPPVWDEACKYKIPPNAAVRIAFRQYMEPTTKIGPAEAELIFDRVIVFRPKQ